MKNLVLRLLSVALAALLWFVIAAEKTSEVGRRVPVEMQNVPKDLELTGDAVNAVDVRLRGSPAIIQRLEQGAVSAVIDLSGVSEGERIIHLSEAAIRMPFGVRVVKIDPSILTLQLERTLDKLVPVRPRLLGRPAQGFEVWELASEPPQIRIAGPRSRVQETESVFTEPISVEGAKLDVVETVALGIGNPSLRIIDHTRVRVVAKVRELHEKRAFLGLPVSPRGGSALLRPKAVSVTVSGPASLLSRMSPSDLRAYVDVSALRGPSRLPVAVEILPGYAAVSLERAEPAEVLARRGGTPIR